MRFSKTKSVLMAFLIAISAFYINFNINVVAETVKIGYVAETGVNIRKDAGVNSDSLLKVSQAYLKVSGSKKDIKSTKNPNTKSVYIWYAVSYTSAGATVSGYIREDYITVKSYTLDSSFSKKLTDFPESYHNDLILLHAIFPNWTFTADKVKESFLQSVSREDMLFYKLVQSSYNSWRSMRKGCYDWTEKKFVETDSGGWYGASREVIAYYMDPRNFLNPNDVYQFLSQSFNAKTQTVTGIEEIVGGTFLDAKISDKNDEFYGKRYAEVIYSAAKKSGVNAYVLASTIIQEHGSGGSTLSKGVSYKSKTVYNFFNYGASGSTSSQVLENGKKYAYDQKWFTPTESIVGGAIKYGSGYIAAGQDTYFYKNFNVLDFENIWHQYAQNVADSLNSSKILKSAYVEDRDLALNFRIPVYTSISSSVSALPDKNSKLNNYYFTDINVTGLTPSFNKYTYEYALSVNGDTTVNLKLPDGASFTGNSSVSLKKGNNEVSLTVKSQTGYKNTYLINVDATKKCTLYLSAGGTANTTASVVCGDTNSDGKVTIGDLANVRLHLLNLITLTGDNLSGADTNGDGKITIGDLANIRLHLLKLITLK